MTSSEVPVLCKTGSTVVSGEYYLDSIGRGCWTTQALRSVCNLYNRLHIRPSFRNCSQVWANVINIKKWWGKAPPRVRKHTLKFFIIVLYEVASGAFSVTFKTINEYWSQSQSLFYMTSELLRWGEIVLRWGTRPTSPHPK